MLRLRIVPPDGEPFDHVAQASSIVVGRSSAADLVVPDPFLSRKHARLFHEGGSWLVEDLGSRNTTLLNGTAVERPMRIYAGDIVKLSTTVIRICDVGGGEARRPDSEDGVFRPAAEVLKDSEAEDTADLQGEAALRRRAERLKLLNEVHGTLCRPGSVQELLDLILDRAFSQLHPEEGAVLLRAADGSLEPIVSRGSGPSDLLCSRHLAAEVTEKKLAALVLDVHSDERFASSDSIAGAGVRSLVAAPLVDPEGVLGMIVLGSRAHVRRFSEEDLELLVSLASVAALRVRNAALMEEVLRQRQLERELTLARDIQLSLLQASLPELAGFTMHAATLPSRTVSGDFYKVVERRDGRECLFMVVDVAGKGLSASLLTASLEALSANPIDAGLLPAEICAVLSRHLHLRTAPERYATAFVGLVEADTGLLRYASAGHNPAIAVRLSGRAERLAATGIPLGVLESADYSTESTVLMPGEALLVYTDGLSEAANPEGEEYGLERLAAVGGTHRSAAASELAGAIGESLEAFVQGQTYPDDRTLLVLKRTEEDG